MAIGLGVYRAVTALAGVFLAPLLRLGAPGGSALSLALSPAGAEVTGASGAVWVHAASMGEVVAARRWVETLVAHGHRPPFLLTTRTRAGLARAQAELPGRVLARIAPADLPGPVRSMLRAAFPARLDILETEVWPNLILEARRAEVPVLFVSGTLSERSLKRLRASGLAGRALLGEGVWVLAQSEPDAARFRSLGVPADRVAVTGDVKAEPPGPPGTPPSRRPAVVFGSLRPGEEAAALAIAGAAPRRNRVCVLAPRHDEGAARVEEALKSAGLRALVRGEASRERESIREWVEGLAAGGESAVGLLATRGELAGAYEQAAVAVVGGTFAEFGGHNVLEPAARGCPVVIGPYHASIEGAVSSLLAQGALEVARDPAEAARLVGAWLDTPERLDRAGEGARAAACDASLAAERAYEAACAFGLEP